MRLLLAACVAYGLFSNHWARDSLGAIETPLESKPPYELSARQYHWLTSIYFIPNIAMPVVAGLLAHTYGASLIYVLCFAVAAAGNVLVCLSSLGGHDSAFVLLLCGRALMGLAYEAVDLLPIGFMAPRFETSWSTLVGILNGVNRLAHSNRTGGLRLALLIPSVVGASGLLSALVAWRIDRSDKRARSESQEPTVAPMSLTRHSLSHIPYLFWLYVIGGEEFQTPVPTYPAHPFALSQARVSMVVPFWFIGAKHLQVKFGMSLAASDALLLFPEGMIMIVAPPFGLLIDRQKWSLTKRLMASALSLAAIPAALLSLAWLPLSPTLVTLVLGVAYAFAQNLIWASITLVSPAPLLNLCSGLTGQRRRSHP
ncbi:MAG: hypothetical protein SGPRY_005624 [Prymnesium sp.]